MSGELAILFLEMLTALADAAIYLKIFIIILLLKFLTTFYKAQKWTVAKYKNSR